MPIYEVQSPYGILEIEGPENASEKDLIAAAMSYTPPPPPKKKKGLGADIMRGAEDIIASSRTGIEALFGNKEAAAEAGLARKEGLEQKYEDDVSLEKVKDIYEKKGTLAAAGEVARQIPHAIAGQLPQFATMGGGAALGARVGSVFGPLGAVIGGAGGAGVGSLLQQFGTNIERQAQEQRKDEKPVDINLQAAGAGAIPQAALDVVEGRLLFGSKLISGLLGIPEKQAAKMAADKLEALAAERLVPTLLKGTGRGLIAELPTEITQQLIERAQAGLPLFDKEAMDEYTDTAYQVGLLAPLGAIGRVADKSQARTEKAKREVEEAERQRAEQERLRLEEEQRRLEEAERLRKEALAPTPFTPLTGERDIAGAVPEGRLPEQTVPIVDPVTGKITGYEAPPAGPPLAPELTGEQVPLPLQPQVGGQYDLFPGGPEPLQPTPTAAPPAPMPEPAPPEPLGDFLKGVVKNVKEDIAAPKILKMNNPATAKVIEDRISEGRPEGFDPIQAMEDLYTKVTEGTAKALSDPQMALLEAAYKRMTNMDITEGIRNRAFQVAPQSELFAEKEAAPAPTAETTKAVWKSKDFDFPVEVINEAPVVKDGVSYSKVIYQGKETFVPTNELEGYTPPTPTPEAGAPAAPTPTPEAGAPTAPTPAPTPTAPRDPAKEWNDLRNDDHPEFSTLNPEEQQRWTNLVNRGLGTPVNFQDLAGEHFERIRKETEKTPQEIEKIFEEEKVSTRANIEDDIKNLSYDGLLDYAVNNGPPAMRELMKKVKEAVDRMKARGYKFTYTLATSPRISRAMELSSKAAGHVYPKGSLMELVISGTGSGRPFGANYETVMHELLHSVTIPLIHYGTMNPNTKEGRIVQELETLRDHVLKTLRRKAKDGTIKPHEMQFLTGTNAFGSKRHGRIIHKADELVSWSMTSSDFRRVLEGVPYKSKNALTAFVDMIRRLIGLAPKQETALAEVINLTEQLVTSETAIAPSPFFGKPLGAVGEGVINTPEFKKWFQGSKVVNPDGTPKVMYHGTRASFDEFKRQIIFVSPEVRVANKFAANDMTWREGKTFDEGANIMPLFVKAENPFDYENPQHVKQVAKKVKEIAKADGFDPYRNPRIKQIISDISSGSWTAIEEPLVWESIVDLGFDSAYLMEFGAKNIALFNKNQVKSAFKSKFGPGPSIFESQTTAKEKIKPDEMEVGKFYKINVEKDGAKKSFIGKLINKNQRLSRFEEYKKDGGVSDRVQLVDTNLIKAVTPLEQDLMYGGFKTKTEEGPFSSEAAAPAPTPTAAPKGPSRLTKLQPTPTTGQQIKDTVQKAKDAFAGDWWTRFRIAAVDPASGLAKTLSSLPIFQDGRLRADMLLRSFNQVINLIKNGLQSGIPVLNADGSVIIQRDQNNLRRSQIMADTLDENATVKASGMSGRGYVSEISRILRGEEIMQIDAQRRQTAKLYMAKAAIELKKAYSDFKQGFISRTALNKAQSYAKAIQKRYKPDLKLNREKQVTQEHIDWAKEQLKLVPEVEQIFDIWRGINTRLVDLWQATGLLTEEHANNLKRQTRYVPLYASRVDLLQEELETYTGKSTGTKTVAEIDRLEGSELTRNIWENMDKHYAFMTAKAFQNQTRKVAVQQLMSAGIDAAKYAEGPDDKRINLRYKDPSNPNADNNGVVHVIVDNPNDVAAFQMMHYELNPIMKAFSASTQVLRAGALINPMYWIKQLIRDPIHASIAGNLNQIVTPVHAAKEYMRILADNSEEARILAERGVIGQIDPTIDLHDFLKQAGTEKITPSQVDKWAHKIMRMHEASDAATRVSIFKTEKTRALKQGMSEQEATDYAVHKARESINFSVRGNSKTLNFLRHSIPFFSAAITSLDTLYRSATGYGLNPEEKKIAQTLFAKRAAMMFILSSAYAMMMQDDDDYKKLPDNVKDNNWLLPSPIGSEHTFIKIPVPFEVGFLFKTLPEGAIRYMSETSTGKEVLASYRQGVLRNLPGEGVILPQVLKPGLEAITNYSFFTNRPIEGMSDQGLPVSERGPNATEGAKILSSLGLDKLGFSPAKIDHLTQGYFAELGTFFAGVSSSMIAAAEGKTPPTKNIEETAFFKNFLTNPNTSNAATDFYDIMHNSQETVNAFNRMKKTGRIEEAKELISDEEKRKLIAVAPSLRKIQDQMSLIRQNIAKYRNAYDMDPDMRRDKINELQVKYDAVAKRGYKVLEAAGIER